MREPVVKREPVKSEPEIVRAPVPIVPPPALIEADGRRVCANDKCVDSDGIRTRFIPEYPTQYHCSTECAAVGFYKRHGMDSSVIEKRVAESVAAAGSETSTRASRRDPAREAEKEARYGPLRKVVEVLSESKAGKRVKFECAHPGSVAKFAKRGRCRLCKKAADAESPKGQERAASSVSPAETERAVLREPPVTKERAARVKSPVPIKRAVVKKSPVKRERATGCESPVKTKRRPIKTKRGKK